MNSNRIPGPNDNCANPAGPHYCVGAIWRYNPQAAGADTATFGQCERMFIQRETDCANVANWSEICTNTSPNNPNTLKVGYAAQPTFPNSVISQLRYDRVVSPDPRNAISYNPANGRFTANCSGRFEVEGFLLYPNITYQNAGNLVGVPNPDPNGQQIELVTYLRKNGLGAFTQRMGINNFREGRHYPGVSITGTVELNAGEFFELLTYQNHNAAIQLGPVEIALENSHVNVHRDGC